MNGNGSPPILTAPVISKLPLGLLGLLGIKSGGAYPQSVGNLVNMVMPEFLPWLATAHREIRFDVAVPITAVNFAPSTIVTPQTELWYVDHVEATIFTDATETWTGNAAVLTYQGMSFDVSSGVSIGASGQRHMPSAQSTPFFMGPGDTLGFMTDLITGAPLASNGQVRCSLLRLPI